MAKSILLSDAIDEYLEIRKVSQRPSTVTQERSSLKKLLAVVGNIQTRHLEGRHGEAMLGYLARTQQPNSIRAEFARLRVFSRWLKSRYYLAITAAPFEHTPMPRVQKRQKLRLPEVDFPALLDAAANPRDRVVVALGLYLFLRQSEMRFLRVSDLDFDAKDVYVTIIKTSTDPDIMPMCEELEIELRNWLLWYRASLKAQGVELRPDHHLVPTMTRAIFRTEKGHQGHLGMTQLLVPDKPIGAPERVVHKAMNTLGYATRDAAGKSLSEGVHTLRRSGARALFDRLLADGYDGALRTVQAMLHHTNSRVTEGYLGIDVDKKRRNDLLRGRSMYGQKAVAAPLRLVSGEGH